MLKRFETWIRNIVWEEAQRASRHFERPVDRTDRLVRLVLDLHDKKWSIQSDSFLRELNINPEKYWQKYNKSKKK